MTDEMILHEVTAVVRPFLGSDVAVTPDTMLLESGAIDSASMINILLELEARLGIQLGADDLSFDHFQSCRMLAEALATRVNA